MNRLKFVLLASPYTSSIWLVCIYIYIAKGIHLSVDRIRFKEEINGDYILYTIEIDNLSYINLKNYILLATKIELMTLSMNEMYVSLRPYTITYYCHKNLHNIKLSGIYNINFTHIKYAQVLSLIV